MSDRDGLDDNEICFSVMGGVVVVKGFERATSETLAWKVDHMLNGYRALHIKPQRPIGAYNGPNGAMALPKTFASLHVCHDPPPPK